jgi:predicted kinase
MKVKILRGLPGSGKSTYAKTLSNAIVCSADDYHMVDGEYKFNPANVSKAHQDCLRAFVEECQSDDFDYLVVDNTNTTALEIAPYFRIAEAYGLDIEILEFECSITTSVERNVHGVPRHVIERMDRNLRQKRPSAFWPFKIIKE